MDRSRIVVTGASGFLGLQLVEALQHRFEVHAVARESPARRGAAASGEVRWYFVDLTDRRQLDDLVQGLSVHGPVELVLHFAGYYDFTGEAHPDYRRVNVEATRGMLRAARAWRARDFVLASSVAACAFPPSGAELDESAPADGETPYGRSKRAAEELVEAARDGLRGWNLRFGAVFSDWCEYEPLYRFLETWLLAHPRGRLLAGAGESALPYLHVRDAISFVERLIDRRDTLDCRERLLACPANVTSHRELHAIATACHFGARLPAVFVPKLFCRAGLRLRHAVGRISGSPPFERPWMGAYIDRQLRVDASRSWKRLDWRPRPRFEIRRRMPFLIQNRKAFPSEWHRRNHSRIRTRTAAPNLEIYREIESRESELIEQLVSFVTDPCRRERFTILQRFEAGLVRADGELLLTALVDSVATNDQHLFQGACRDLAERRSADAVPCDEIRGFVNALGDLVELQLAHLHDDPTWSLALVDHVSMTVQFGLDEMLDVFDEAS